MSEPQEKILALLNQGFDFGEQTILGADCAINPFPTIAPTNNLIVLNLTSQEWVELVSSILVGSEWAYPDKSHQILWNFIKSVHCPPIMAEQECFEYPTYASFIRYLPTNPYVEPDTIPSGYLTAPFVVNGQNGYQDDNYQPFDIISLFGSFEIIGNWFDLLDGVLPQITVTVDGAGKVFIKLLPQFNGGLVIVTLDAPPNLIDIFGGIVTGADNILDMNLDNVSLPPETASEIIYELEITGTGLHTIWITFIPVVDDALIPLRYGGGFRGVQLCDFVGQPTMGIENIRFDGASCELQTLVDGNWEQVSGWEDWLSCVPSGGGGGGATNIKVGTRHLELSANVTQVGVTFADAFVFSWTPTYSKMLAIISNVGLLNSAGTRWAEINLLFNGNAGDNPTVIAVQDNTRQNVSISDWWQGLTIGVAHDIKVQLRARTAGDTATISAKARINLTVIEYENASDLYVEDIRILNEELQKKIAGVWITVTDSLKTLFDAVQATAATALTNANSAIATNVTQAAQIATITTTNNTQNSRLSDLEAQQIIQNNAISDNMDEIAIHDTRMDNIDIINTDQQTRIEDLEASLSAVGLEFWYKEWSFLSSANGWSSPEASWVSGQGFKSSSPFNMLFTGTTFRDCKLTHMKITGRRQTGGFGQSKITWANVDDYAILEWSGGTLLNSQWMHIGNKIVQPNVPAFYFSDFSGEFRIEGIKLLGRGVNLFP